MIPLPKSEARSPEGRRKAETRSPKNSLTRLVSEFGLRPSFGFRPSDFGFRGPSARPRPRNTSDGNRGRGRRRGRARFIGFLASLIPLLAALLLGCLTLQA